MMYVVMSIVMLIMIMTVDRYIMYVHDLRMDKYEQKLQKKKAFLKS